MITYTVHNGIETNDLIKLYESVGWSGYTADREKMEKILSHSLWYMSAYEKDELVGMIRLVGDACSIIYVQDILVLPSHQRKGIGSYLLKEALKTFKDIRQFVLITEDSEKTKAFYKSAGFLTVEETKGICFVRYNFDA